MHKPLKTSLLNTPLGPMMAISSEEALCLLEFVDTCGIERLTKSPLISGRTQPIDLIEKELNLYFCGKLKEFKTPLYIPGTPFQKRVWQELRKIPYGKTISYADLAIAIGNPKACRAVAQANGANRFPIIIPCHRVINANGELGGYSSGVTRKKWLIDHEQ